jgi:hypothetical protein
MDPQTTWESLIQAWCARDWSRVQEYADALIEWLEHGGFAPVTLPNVRLGDDWNAAVVAAACGFALRRSQQVLRDANGIPADVPFSLVCADCVDVGPTSYANAMEQGWGDIEYVPAEPGENFLGLCRRCRQARHTLEGD